MLATGKGEASCKRARDLTVSARAQLVSSDHAHRDPRHRNTSKAAFSRPRPKRGGFTRRRLRHRCGAVMGRWLVGAVVGRLSCLSRFL
eukprot:5118879-Prymnesium_polylepis.1